MAKLTSTTIYGSANITGNLVSTGNTFAVSPVNGLTFGTGNTSVVSINKTAVGSGYTSNLTATISSPTTFGGATATANLVHSLATATKVNAGSGYINGEILTVSGGVLYATSATVQITVISGGVDTLTVVNAGSYWTIPNGGAAGVALTGGSGTGATASFTWNWQGTSLVTNPGSGYIESPTLTITGTAGSGATGYPYLGGVNSATVAKFTAGYLNFNSPNGTVLALGDNSLGPATGYLQITQAQNNGGVTVQSTGSNATTPLFIGAPASSTLNFFVGGSGNRTMQMPYVASSVNYLSLVGNTTGGGVVIAGAGSDTNVGINITPKGAGSANVVSTANSTSNTTGALVVTGGMGITGNLFMSAANNYSFTTSDQNSYRLGWTDNYFTRSPTFNGVYFTGNFLAIRTGTFYIEPASSLIARGVISNDSGNNTVIFAPSSPVRLQNTAASTSNTTGSLIVGGGVGVSGNIYVSGTNTGITSPNVTLTQVATASFPLSFGATLGNKIGLYDAGSGAGYGLGIQSSQLQIFTQTAGSVTSIGLGNSSSFTEQFRVTTIASAVNYLQVAGNTTGGGVVISGQGSDTNVGININPKGAGSVNVTSTSTIINGQMTARGNVTVNGDIVVANSSTSNTATIKFNAALGTLDFIINLL